MEILKKLQKITGEKLIQKRLACPFDDYCKGEFTFQDRIIKFCMSSRSKDIEIYEPATDRFYVNVADWLCEHTVSFNEIEVEEADEWDVHGFRDEQDYINYKYK